MWPDDRSEKDDEGDQARGDQWDQQPRPASKPTEAHQLIKLREGDFSGDMFPKAHSSGIYRLNILSFKLNGSLYIYSGST